MKFPKAALYFVSISLTVSGAIANASTKPTIECKVSSLVAGDEKEPIQPGRTVTVRSQVDPKGKCPQIIQKDMAFEFCVYSEEFNGGYDVNIQARTLLEDSDKGNYGGPSMTYGTSAIRKGELVALYGTNTLITKQVRNLGTHGLGYFSGDLEVVDDAYVMGDLNEAASKALQMGILKPAEPLVYVVNGCRLVKN